VRDYEAVFKSISEYSKVPVSFEKLHPELHGYYSKDENRIVIAEGMSELQTLKTYIHEVAHSMLHGSGKDAEKSDRSTREVQAESVAYTVCQHYGLDTSDYSFGYVAAWGSNKGVSVLKDSLETVQKTASQIIKGIDQYLPDIQKQIEYEKSRERAVVPKNFYAKFGINAETERKPSIRDQLRELAYKAIPHKEVRQRELER